jgi:hypothetical protein
MGGEKKARGAGGLRGQAETAGGQRRLDLHLGETGGQRAAFQAFFQGPGALLGGTRLDDEKAGGIQPGAQQAGAIGATPFPCLGPGQAP